MRLSQQILEHFLVDFYSNSCVWLGPEKKDPFENFQNELQTKLPKFWQSTYKPPSKPWLCIINREQLIK